jgi:hypothetical protein
MAVEATPTGLEAAPAAGPIKVGRGKPLKGASGLGWAFC